MHFPTIEEISSSHVVSIEIDASIRQAIDRMIQNDHRNIVIVRDGGFSLLRASDVLLSTLHGQDMEQPVHLLELHEMETVHKGSNIVDSIDLLQSELEIIAVVDDDSSLCGVVTHTDIVSSIDPETLMENYRLCDFVKGNKNSRCVERGVITRDILRDMQLYNQDSIIVLESQRPIGILTTKDILRLLRECSDLSRPIEQLMTSPVVSIDSKCTVNEALAFMKDKKFKRIVTVDDDRKLVGIITQRELISLTYNRWVVMLKEYHKELNDINSMLQQRSDRYERIAGTDPLTGLYNRIKFLELYVSQYAVMTKRHNRMSLIIIDLDHFKEINDQYGHNVGDMVLKQASIVLLKALRSVDVLCRWGGEEFVALLPAASLQQAEHIAQIIRQALDDLRRDDMPHITASFGVTEVREGDTLGSAVERADAALYEAKYAGRNTVRCG
ncbi:MAG: diguanylate cyclase [Gammaproteobacteria bacterium]|nr:diguanylate cyclase [Gammaproteobacteria bacterium]